MNAALTTLVVTAGSAGLWYAVTIVRGVMQLRPQIRIASKMARQQKQAQVVAQLDIESLLFHAQNGNPAAQARVGLMYANGDGLGRDSTKAVSFFTRAAEAGFFDAQYCLGLAYDKGRGVQVDEAKARSWYEAAARNGSASAQCNLGVLYLRQNDLVSAAYWFLKAAAHKQDEALDNLKWFVEHKNLVRSDRDLIPHYRDAATRGEIDAQYLLAWCYEQGVGIQADLYEAAAWYKRAAKGGHMLAHDAVAREG
jgi:TPR repeat protein